MVAVYVFPYVNQAHYGRTHTHTRTNDPDDSVAMRGPTSETRRRVEVITTMCQKSLQRFVVPNDTGRVVRLGGRRWSI
jgi:hypothetical protein